MSEISLGFDTPTQRLDILYSKSTLFFLLWKLNHILKGATQLTLAIGTLVRRVRFGTDTIVCDKFMCELGVKVSTPFSHLVMTAYASETLYRRKGFECDNCLNVNSKH